MLLRSQKSRLYTIVLISQIYARGSDRPLLLAPNTTQYTLNHPKDCTSKRSPPSSMEAENYPADPFTQTIGKYTECHKADQLNHECQDLKGSQSISL